MLSSVLLSIFFLWLSVLIAEEIYKLGKKPDSFDIMLKFIFYTILFIITSSCASLPIVLLILGEW